MRPLKNLSKPTRSNSKETGYLKPQTKINIKQSATHCEYSDTRDGKNTIAIFGKPQRFEQRKKCKRATYVMSAIGSGLADRVFKNIRA